MKLTGPAKELRIYVGESDRHQGRPLYHALVEELKREGLAGVTVVRGIEGFGANSRIHTANILRLSEDLPMVVIAVDAAERIERVLPRLAEMVREGLITVHDVAVVKYAHAARPGEGASQG